MVEISIYSKLMLCSNNKINVKVPELLADDVARSATRFRKRTNLDFAGLQSHDHAHHMTIDVA